MEKYSNIITGSYSGYFGYLLHEVTTMHIENYFYGLILISLAVWILEQEIYPLKF